MQFIHYYLKIFGKIVVKYRRRLRLRKHGVKQFLQYQKPLLIRINWQLGLRNFIFRSYELLKWHISNHLSPSGDLLLLVFACRRTKCRFTPSVKHFTILTFFWKLQGQLLPFLTWNIFKIRVIKNMKCIT